MDADSMNKTRFFPQPCDIAPFLTGERGQLALACYLTPLPQRTYKYVVARVRNGEVRVVAGRSGR
jgi:hypothetical protein